MAVQIVRTRNRIGSYLDIAETSENFQSIPDDLRTEILGHGRALQADVEASLEADEQDRKSGQYTRAGLTERMQQRRKVLGEKLAKLESRAQLHDDRATSAINTALAPRKLDAIDAMRHREIRDLLRNDDRLRVQADYLAACRSGENEDLIAAVEGSPKGFELVTSDTLAKGRAMRGERLAPQAQIHQRAAGELRYLIGAARRDLEMAPDSVPIERAS